MNCVVIPAYRAAGSILSVIEAVGAEIELIVVVDDGCPEGTGVVVANRCDDPRVVTLMHDANQGVGGAFLTGMRYAIARGADTIIKVDADGQMDPAQVPALIHPITSGQADYVKGDRFFFETDLLFHLGLIRAKVVEFPMRASYGNEVSNLRVSHQLGPFLAGHLRNTTRRILYRYFFRDLSLASLQLVAGLALFLFGLVFGLYHWWAAPPDQLVPTGTIMIAALTFLMGFQLVLAFLNYDISATPREPLHPFLKGWHAAKLSEPEKAHIVRADGEQAKPVRRQA